jgi:hypothetical protein
MDSLLVFVFAFVLFLLTTAGARVASVVRRVSEEVGAVVLVLDLTLGTNEAAVTVAPSIAAVAVVVADAVAVAAVSPVPAALRFFFPVRIPANMVICRLKLRLTLRVLFLVWGLCRCDGLVYRLVKIGLRSSQYR